MGVPTLSLLLYSVAPLAFFLYSLLFVHEYVKSTCSLAFLIYCFIVECLLLSLDTGSSSVIQKTRDRFGCLFCKIDFENYFKNND